MMSHLEYDVVIIGSGAGGGAVAAELAPFVASGLRVALFEWGGSFRSSENNQKEFEMASKYYFDSGALLNETNDITFAAARAVGGSTTVYTGTSLELPETVVNRWNTSGITSEDLKPRYAKYKLQNSVHLLSEEELNENNKRFRDSCSRLGWHCEQFPINAKDCAGLGTCNLGCPRLAKQGTHVVQLPYAAKHGVQIFSWSEVLEIDEHTILVRVHPPQQGREPSLLDPGDYLVHFDKVVVAAGALGTPAILQKSVGFSHLPALGSFLTCHPSMMIAGKHPNSISSQSGHPKSFYCEEFLESKRFLLETCMYYPFTFSKNVWGYGADLEAFITPFNHLQMILAFAIDESRKENRVDHHPKKLFKIQYSLSQATKTALRDSMGAAAEILFESGATDVHIPLTSKFLTSRADRGTLSEQIQNDAASWGRFMLSAAHLMGTCRMGSSIEDSVTDSWGKVHDVEDVYIADASLFPRASEVNPYLTIMALADRVAEGLKKDLRLV